MVRLILFAKTNPVSLIKYMIDVFIFANWCVVAETLKKRGSLLF